MGGSERIERTTGKSYVDPENDNNLDFPSPKCPKFSVIGGERLVNAASASSCFCSLILWFTPIRTSNLDPLIPVSSGSLGGSSLISHSWTDTGFLMNALVLAVVLFCIQCAWHKWVISGLRVWPPASFRSQIFNPYFQCFQVICRHVWQSKRILPNLRFTLH